MLFLPAGLVHTGLLYATLYGMVWFRYHGTTTVQQYCTGIPLVYIAGSFTMLYQEKSFVTPQNVVDTVCMNLCLQCVCASVLFGMVLISFVSSFKATNRFRNFSGRYAKSSLSRSVSNSAFEKLESFQLKEYGLSGDWFTHRKTGAEVIHFVMQPHCIL